MALDKANANECVFTPNDGSGVLSTAFRRGLIEA